MREEVVLAETDPLGGLIHSVVGYVIGLEIFLRVLEHEMNKHACTMKTYYSEYL
jgi:hypothetical protein